MRFTEVAYKLKFSPGDPAVFGSSDSYDVSQAFRCDWRPITAEQQIRAGRDSAEKGIRIYYRPMGIELSNGDRIRVRGKEYSVVYADMKRTNTGIIYVDAKEVPE